MGDTRDSARAKCGRGVDASGALFAQTAAPELPAARQLSSTSAS